MVRIMVEASDIEKCNKYIDLLYRKIVELGYKI